MDARAAIASLSALAHEGRLATFRMLVQAGPDGLAAGEIARRLDVLPNSLSSNLNILTHAGLSRSQRNGRSIIYSADYEAMSGLLAFLMEDCCAGSPEICAPLVETLNRSVCCADDAIKKLEKTR
jgi:DNA-binding transcriptional ArsR family regulator